jgi:flagellar protein FlbT
MSSVFRMALQANQRIFVNGAVLRVDRKVGIEFLNDATFLMDSYVLQPEQVTSPLRQIYYVVQSLLIDPASRDTSMAVYSTMLDKMLSAYSDQGVLHGLKQADSEVRAGRAFDALKTLKGLFDMEARLLAAVPVKVTAGVGQAHEVPTATLEGNKA